MGADGEHGCEGAIAMTIEDIKQTDLTQAERDVLKADGVRWKRMGNAGHLYDWLAYHPGLSIRRRLAMKMAHTNRPEGKNGSVQILSHMWNGPP
jgi:hypothetical protein